MCNTIYRTMYLHLFNAVTDALLKLDSGDMPAVADRLKSAQSECEEMYLSSSGQDEETSDCL